MAFKDDITKILRAQLGEGFEKVSLDKLKTAYLKRQLEPYLRALYEGRIDRMGLAAAREDVERAFAVEQLGVQEARLLAVAKARKDIDGLV